MKVILMKDVAKIGRRSEVKEVSDGYALNFLFPRNLAVRATESEILKLSKDKEQKEESEKQKVSEFVSRIESFSNKSVIIETKANEKGHLFKGVTKSDIARVVSKYMELDLEPESVILDKPIKELGEYEIEVESLGKKARVKINIVNKK